MRTGGYCPLVEKRNKENTKIIIQQWIPCRCRDQSW